jgi:hypothetical protein
MEEPLKDRTGSARVERDELGEEPGMKEDGAHEEEPVDDLLVLGLLFVPVVAVWFLLRRHYSREIRIGAAIYAAAVAVAAGLWLSDRLRLP